MRMCSHSVILHQIPVLKRNPPHPSQTQHLDQLRHIPWTSIVSRHILSSQNSPPVSLDSQPQFSFVSSSTPFMLPSTSCSHHPQPLSHSRLVVQSSSSLSRHIHDCLWEFVCGYKQLLHQDHAAPALSASTASAAAAEAAAAAAALNPAATTCFFGGIGSIMGKW